MQRSMHPSWQTNTSPQHAAPAEECMRGSSSSGAHRCRRWRTSRWAAPPAAAPPPWRLRNANARLRTMRRRRRACAVAGPERQRRGRIAMASCQRHAAAAVQRWAPPSMAPPSSGNPAAAQLPQVAPLPPGSRSWHLGMSGSADSTRLSMPLITGSAMKLVVSWSFAGSRNSLSCAPGRAGGRAEGLMQTGAAGLGLCGVPHNWQQQAAPRHHSRAVHVPLRRWQSWRGRNGAGPPGSWRWRGPGGPRPCGTSRWTAAAAGKCGNLRHDVQAGCGAAAPPGSAPRSHSASPASCVHRWPIPPATAAPGLVPRCSCHPTSWGGAQAAKSLGQRPRTWICRGPPRCHSAGGQRSGRAVQAGPPGP